MPSDSVQGSVLGGRQGTEWKRSPCFLVPSDDVCSLSRRGDGFSLDSTSHPSPASPLGGRQPRLLTLAPPFPCWVTLGKPLSLSVPNFSIGEIGNNYKTCFKG